MSLRQFTFLLAGIVLVASAHAATRSERDLHRAARAGDMAEIERLLERGTNINAPARLGSTALHEAVRASRRLDLAKRKGHIDFLIKRGANVNTRDSYGFTPLHFAMTREAGLAIQLIDAGADVNVTNNNGASPLMYALASRKFDEAGFSDLLTSMSASGLKINAVGRRGDTLLHVAARNRPQLVVDLVNANANPNVINDRGETPLHLASAWHPPDHLDIAGAVEALIAAGADVNAVDKLGNTPLTRAMASGARVLLAHSALVDPPQGEPPLHFAAFRGDAETVKLLLAAGADPRRRWRDMRAMDRAASGLTSNYESYRRAKSFPGSAGYFDVMAQLQAAGGASLAEKTVQIVGINPALWRRMKQFTAFFGVFFSAGIALLLLSIVTSFSKRLKEKRSGRALLRASWLSLTGTAILLGVGAFVTAEADEAAFVVMVFVVPLSWFAAFIQLVLWFSLYKRKLAN